MLTGPLSYVVAELYKAMPKSCQLIRVMVHASENHSMVHGGLKLDASYITIFWNHSSLVALLFGGAARSRKGFRADRRPVNCANGVANFSDAASWRQILTAEGITGRADGVHKTRKHVHWHGFALILRNCAQPHFLIE